MRSLATQPATTTRPTVFKRSIDRKSTRLNSSHSQISYAVFCLKKKKKQNIELLKRYHCNHRLIIISDLEYFDRLVVLLHTQSPPTCCSVYTSEVDNEHVL